MSAAFEQAWMLLKAVFQPAEGYRIGEGRNQIVYGQEGDPDVTKVGRPESLRHMYIHQLLSGMPYSFFAGQSPIAQTMDLPMEAQSKVGEAAVPILSQQERGIPLEEGESEVSDALRGRYIADAIYDMPGERGRLLEALGLSDVKPPNWMQSMNNRGTPVSQVTGNPLHSGYAVIHDPMFYGSDNPSDFEERMNAIAARGTPRRLGIDYTIPEDVKQLFARRVDELPFEQFTQPVFDYEVPMSAAQEGLLHDQYRLQEDNLQSMLGRIGVLG